MEVKMLTTQEVADRLRVKVITVQRWLHDGKLRGTKLPGRAGWRVPESEVSRMMGGTESQPTPGAQEAQ